MTPAYAEGLLSAPATGDESVLHVLVLPVQVGTCIDRLRDERAEGDRAGSRTCRRRRIGG